MNYLCGQYLAGNSQVIKLLDESMNVAADLAYLEECENTGMDPYTKGYGITHRFYDQEQEIKDIRKHAHRLVQLIENAGAQRLSTYNDPNRNQLIQDMLEITLVNVNNTGEDRVMWIFQKNEHDMKSVQENVHENMGFEYYVKTCTIVWSSRNGAISYGIEYNANVMERRNVLHNFQHTKKEMEIHDV